MRRVVISAVLVLMLLPAATAQGTPAPNPGLIAADNPLYDVKVQIEDTLVRWEMKEPATVAQQRAVELQDLHERDAATPDRVETVTASLEEHSSTAVETVGGEDVTVEDGDVHVTTEDGTVRITDGDIQVDGPDGSVSITDDRIHVEGPEGEVEVTDGGVSVDGPNGSVDIDDGAISVDGPDGSVDIDSDGIRVDAQQRQAALGETQQILEAVNADTDDAAFTGLDDTIAHVEQQRQQLTRIEQEIDAAVQQIEQDAAAE